ncbi:MAG: SusC/RagA family TonB-linked outer membrane protein [Gemmatimonadaceae bacterium]|nr:SusC/RagA family TonB-linked outer membrane protein [Gemmatimonadaceae bacterium]
MAAAVGGLILANPLQAQGARGAISGRVIDSTSQLPMQSVTVTIEGTQRGAITRVDGGFTLADLPAGTARLRVTRIGYTPQVKDVAVIPGQTATVRFVMQAVAANLGAVVVTGYGSQRKEAVTGSVATINAEEANVGVVANPTQLLAARAPGVNVTLNSGEPGAGAQIRIRGGTSISASNDPLYVVDGVPLQNNESEARGYGIGGSAALGRNPLNAINPSDISSVTVLKDAAATAIYGSRGANGVVLIETKKGRSGAATMEYETYAAFGQAANALEPLSAAQYRALLTKEIANTNNPAATRTALSTQLAGLGTANTNWESELQRTALTQNHNVSFAGGNQTTTFRASLNFADQQGVVISNGFKRLQARLNGSHEALNGRLRIGLNLSSSRIENDYLPFENTGGFEGGVFQNSVIYLPTNPVFVTNTTTQAQSYYETGLGRQEKRNPVALANTVLDEGQTMRTLANVTTSFSIFPSLIAQLNVGTDRSNGQRNIYLPRAGSVGSEFGGLAQQSQRALSNQTLQSLLTWSPTVGHEIDFDIVGGYEYTDFDNTDFSAQSRNFTTDAFTFNNLGAGANPQIPQSYQEQSRLVSFFSRANFGYKNKYFLTGVLRRDGSSRFGDANKWAVFPAISGSWLVSDESFAKGLPFSQLKLRAGYGLQGNQAVQPYASLPSLAPDGGARYVFGSTVFTGIVPNVNANPNLKWEQSTQANFAIDYGLSDGKYSGSLEFYSKKTTDLLLTVPISQSGSAFVSTQLQNVGSVQNRGLEFSLDGRMIERSGRGMNLTVGLVASIERNKVLDLGAADFIETGGVSGQGQTGVNSQRIIPGQPIGTFYGAEFAGYNTAGNQLFNKYTVTRDAAGNETSRVLAGTTTSVGADDKVIIGNANPNFSLGLRSNLTWHGFDASWLWRAEQGRDVFNNTGLVYATKQAITAQRNLLSSALDTPEPISEPALYSSRWIEDGSFVRLQNVTIGYTFNLPFGGGSKSTRVYVSGDNLLLFTPYSGYDPEVFIDSGLASRGIDYLSYPRARTFTTGLRIAF